MKTLILMALILLPTAAMAATPTAVDAAVHKVMTETAPGV